MQIGIINRREKLDFFEVEEEGTYLWIWFGFSLNSLTKQKKEKEEGQKND